MQQDHNKRLLASGGIYNCMNDEELVKNINKSLQKPNELSEMRKKIVLNEVGPHKGKAAESISDLLVKFLSCF